MRMDCGESFMVLMLMMITMMKKITMAIRSPTSLSAFSQSSMH